jgi:hypothetical protein
MAMITDQLPLTSSMECMMTSITQPLMRKDLVMRLVTLRESTLLLFLMIQHVIYHADGNYGDNIK